MVLFLVFSALVANPNNYFTPGQSRSWSTDQEKKEIEKVYQCPPPPPRCSFEGNNQKTHARIYMRLGATQVSFRLAPAQRFLRLVDWANWCRFGRFYASVCDDNFTSLSASLFFWRCLAPVYLFFPSRGHDLRPPSATVSTHTSAYNAVAFHPAMPNARMSFYLGGGCRLVCFFLYTFPPNPVLPY